jgi:tetratricopeptide (TPR) repeat protein
MSMCMVGAAAAADGRSYGNDGLEALNRGANDDAVDLFSKAIRAGDLHGDDLEFAYASRGRAYLRKGDISNAVMDLDRARRMKPDDPDAQGDLSTALATALPADQVPGIPKQSFLGQLGRALLAGAVQGLADAAAQSQEQQ